MKKIIFALLLLTNTAFASHISLLPQTFSRMGENAPIERAQNPKFIASVYNTPAGIVYANNFKENHYMHVFNTTNETITLTYKYPNGVFHMLLLFSSTHNYMESFTDSNNNGYIIIGTFTTVED